MRKVILSVIGGLFFFLSMAEGRIAFVRGGNIWLADNSGQSQVQITKEGNFSKPKWSPDGRFLVCERKYKGKLSIWLIDIRQMSAKRLTDYMSSWGLFPTFSSDGEYVIYTRGEVWIQDEYRDQLWAINVKSSKSILLEETAIEPPVFTFLSPCSIAGIKKILWGEIPHEGRSDAFLYLRERKGEFAPLIKTPFIPRKSKFDIWRPFQIFGSPAISWDRQYVAATRYIGIDTGGSEEIKVKDEICIICLKDKQMISFKRLDAFRKEEPFSFSPDNRFLLFRKIPEEKRQKAQKNLPDIYLDLYSSWDLPFGDIWMLDIKKGSARLLIKNGMEPSWSPS